MEQLDCAQGEFVVEVVEPRRVHAELEAGAVLGDPEASEVDGVLPERFETAERLLRRGAVPDLRRQNVVDGSRSSRRRYSASEPAPGSAACSCSSSASTRTGSVRPATRPVEILSVHGSRGERSGLVHRDELSDEVTQGFYREPSSGLEAETPSLPWRFMGGTRGRGWALATPLSLQIEISELASRARGYPCVPNLMYPSRTRGSLPVH